MALGCQVDIAVNHDPDAIRICRQQVSGQQTGGEDWEQRCSGNGTEAGGGQLWIPEIRGEDAEYGDRGRKRRAA